MHNRLCMNSHAWVIRRTNHQCWDHALGALREWNSLWLGRRQNCRILDHGTKTRAQIVFTCEFLDHGSQTRAQCFFICESTKCQWNDHRQRHGKRIEFNVHEIVNIATKRFGNARIGCIPLDPAWWQSHVLTYSPIVIAKRSHANVALAECYRKNGVAIGNRVRLRERLRVAVRKWQSTWPHCPRLHRDECATPSRQMVVETSKRIKTTIAEKHTENAAMRLHIELQSSSVIFEFAPRRAIHPRG